MCSVKMICPRDDYLVQSLITTKEGRNEGRKEGRKEKEGSLMGFTLTADSQQPAASSPQWPHRTSVVY